MKVILYQNINGQCVYRTCLLKEIHINVNEHVRKSNQGNQGYSSNQKNLITGQRPDRENIYIYNKEHK